MLKVENYYLPLIEGFLTEAKLKGGRANRGKVKFLKILSQKLIELEADRLDLMKQYFKCNEKGDLIVNNEGTAIPNNPEAEGIFKKELKELMEETVAIDLADHAEQYQALYQALDDYDLTLSTEEALAYDLLMDKLEVIYNG